jgi:SAM-dependent methyltransferase
MSYMDDQPLLYTDLAPWFHLLTHPDGYVEEAAVFTRVLQEATETPVRTVLELGSGGGNNALHMKRHFQLTLTDLSAEMLALSQTINPELEHIPGDMRSLRLEREFDAVFVHDAITYMTTEADLRAALLTAFVHTKPGGVALIVPDDLFETFEPSTGHGGHDSPDGRGLRYLEWGWDPDPSDTSTIVDFAYLLREPNGTVEAAHDRHSHGLFPRATWLRALEAAGFRVRAEVYTHSEVDRPIDFFVGLRPSQRKEDPGRTPGSSQD